YFLYPNHTAFRFFDSFFLPLNALKNKTLTKAMVEFFAFLKKKITFAKTPENLNGLGIAMKIMKFQLLIKPEN
ncbi:MAG: hypothetical protein L3J08_03905, partial [Flavobacteriaceae bacterium]|nr:hypothetical protein [Flavobacteriaceae bacterium]